MVVRESSILIWRFKLSFQSCNPILSVCGWNCIKNEMGIKVYKLWVFTLWVKNSNKVECLEVLASSDADRLVQIKYTLQAA